MGNSQLKTCNFPKQLPLSYLLPPPPLQRKKKTRVSFRTAGVLKFHPEDSIILHRNLVSSRLQCLVFLSAAQGEIQQGQLRTLSAWSVTMLGGDIWLKQCIRQPVEWFFFDNLATLKWKQQTCIWTTWDLKLLTPVNRVYPIEWVRGSSTLQFTQPCSLSNRGFLQIKQAPFPWPPDSHLRVGIPST